jgi:hypothetical protein
VRRKGASSEKIQNFYRSANTRKILLPDRETIDITPARCAALKP